MSARLGRWAGGLALSLAMAAGGDGIAEAAVVSAMPNATLSGTPVAVSFGSGMASYAFTSASTGFGPGAAVATTGSAQVSNLGGQADFGAGASIDQVGEPYNFTPVQTATTIPFSAADDFIGLAFTLGDGLHFGYAEVNGPVLVSYGYESTPGATILTGATGPAAVPEPGTASLLAACLAGLAAVVGCRRYRPRLS
jgi:hypothetical protein